MWYGVGLARICFSIARAGWLRQVETVRSGGGVRFSPMTGGQALLIGFGLLLGVGSAAFSAFETAIFSLNEERRKKLRSKSPRRADSLSDLLERPDEVVNSMVLANTLTNLPLIVVILYLLDAFRGADDQLGWGLFLVVFGVIIVCCDLLPKLVSLAAPIRTARVGIPLIQFVVPLLAPVCVGLQALCDRIVASVLPRRMRPMPHLTDAELETLVEIGRSEGTIEESESRLIGELMKLAEEPAKHCMTPRVDVFFLPDDLTNEEAAAAVRRKRYRRVLVRGETPDDVVGLLDVKNFLLDPATSYLEHVVPPSYVPETMNALEMLRSFLNRRQRFAILVDEFGGIEGIVTLSDFIEELLGEEGPDSGTELYIESLGDDRFVAAGNARMDDLRELLKWEGEEAGVDSIGGFVVEHLGVLPRPGTILTVDGWRITVRRATRKRIKEVLIEPSPDAVEASESDALAEEAAK